MTDDSVQRLRDHFGQTHPDLSRSMLNRDDWLAATAVLGIVFCSALPVVAPFIFIHRVPTALRLSNGIALAMLFLAGAALCIYSGFGPWKTGAVMVTIGLVLVGITMALGG
jgi:VIT1/CCC1 family predicted Fe2+/Mn2+ transporter